MIAKDQVTDFLMQEESDAKIKCPQTVDRWQARGITHRRIREILPVMLVLREA